MFKDKLNEVIKDNKWSLYKLAKELKVNNQTAINWSKGITEPKASQIRTICKKLDVSADYLLELSEY